MTMVGIIQAKTQFSKLCERVAKRREPIVITRRGRPLVRLEPISAGNGKKSSVWSARAAWDAKHGPVREKFSLPARSRQTWRNPLDD